MPEAWNHLKVVKSERVMACSGRWGHRIVREPVKKREVVERFRER
jgi:hypothetical protein